MTNIQAEGEPGHGWLLERLINTVPGARSAVLLSSDGLPIAAYGLDRDGADHMAALAANLFSTARAAGNRFGSSGDVRQVAVELAEDLLFVSSAGDRSVLAVLTGHEADPGVVGYEMGQFVKGVESHLATPARMPGTPVPGAAGQR